MNTYNSFNELVASSRSEGPLSIFNAKPPDKIFDRLNGLSDDIRRCIDNMIGEDKDEWWAWKLQSTANELEKTAKEARSHYSK